MKWLEVIKLQSAGNCQELQELLLETVGAANRSGVTDIKTYRHAALENDLCVLLYWDSERLEKDGSTLGLHLVQAFNEFGLIDHSVWIGE
jgi:hypothetical protein